MLQSAFSRRCKSLSILGQSGYLQVIFCSSKVQKYHKVFLYKNYFRMFLFLTMQRGCYQTGNQQKAHPWTSCFLSYFHVFWIVTRSEKLHYHRLADCLGVQRKEQARVHAMLSTSYTIFKMQLFPCYEFGCNRGTLEPKIRGFDAFISRDT